MSCVREYIPNTDIAKHVEECLNRSCVPSDGEHAVWCDDLKDNINAGESQVHPAGADSANTADHVEFCQVTSRRARRWDASKRSDASDILPSATGTSSVCVRGDGYQQKSPLEEEHYPQTSSNSSSEHTRSKAPHSVEPAEKKVQPLHDVSSTEAEPIMPWLRRALLPLLDVDAVEALLAGVEVVLDCGSDAEAAENAAELLEAELPDNSAHGTAVLDEFKKRAALATSSRDHR